MGELLNQIKNPGDLKKLPADKLPALAQEIRQEIIEVICERGGHLASSLGAVDIIVALHYLLDAPKDTIVWDVGHQTYAHKILTRGSDKFSTIRQADGISGFPNSTESPYDPFTVGHSSTSISNALGLITARDLAGGKNKVVAVIGDAALAGGMAFEALNHAGHLKKDLLIVLNDNEISISPTIGAMSKYLNRIWTNPLYNRVKKDTEAFLKRMPKFGNKAYMADKRLEDGLKNILTAGIVFEEMGFRYFGPIDGHDINILLEMLKKVMALKEPAIIHVLTKKGKGYKHAEECPAKFHSAPPFDIETGGKRVIADGEREFFDKGKTYTEAFGEHISEIAANNNKIVAVTAAMPDGTGLAGFSKLFPERFFDVGIAEQHAVGFAAGLARGGFLPVVAIYSTFLQRSYDQIVHDVALQNFSVIFCLDRAGLVGEDGPTHHGLFDIAYLRPIPRMVVMAPADAQELELMLDFAVAHGGPVAIRYPRGAEIKLKTQKKRNAVELGKAETLKDGKDAVILALGSMARTAEDAAALLEKDGINVAVINARFVKPLDGKLIEGLARQTKLFITLEEGVIEGGFGSAVLEFIDEKNISDVKLKRMGLPSAFIEHGSRQELFKKYGLTPEAVAAMVKENYIGKDKDK